jgi:phosphatidylserine/phosphatidylglycerophosphate/cardiolipin synthase-like enzyme
MVLFLFGIYIDFLSKHLIKLFLMISMIKIFKVCGFKYGYLIILIISFLLNSCQSKSSQVIRTANLVQDQDIKVYFNHNLAKDSNYIEPYRNITRMGDNLEQIIIDQINSAQSSIDLAVQEFNLPNVALALGEKKKAGIKIRVILENNYSQSLSKGYNLNIKEEEDDYSQNKYEEYKALVDINQDGILTEDEINQRDVIKILKNAKIPVIDDTEDGTKGSGLMHHKFIIIDQKKVITGSTNFTISDIHGDFGNLETRGNTNHLLDIYSPIMAQLFTTEFNLMWGDGVGGKKDSKFGLKKPFREPQTIEVGNSKVTVNFSPISPTKPWEISSNGLISKTLNQSNRSVDLALFVFSDQKIADTLKSKHNSGVKIRALIDPNFIFQYYSEGLDLLGVAIPTPKCEFEKDNNPWQIPLNTVGMAKLARGDKLHHKFALIDEQIIITGSHNWSASANHNNDETLLIIDNIVVANHFKAEFKRLYENATLGISNALKNKLQEQQTKCPNLDLSIPKNL